jgi:uncharacterized protein DUF4404
MTDPDLRALLAELHARLSHASSVDAGSRKLLKTVLHDIESTLDKSGSLEPEPRLEALAAKFDADHPTLAATLRQIIDTLGRAGI